MIVPRPTATTCMATDPAVSIDGDFQLQPIELGLRGEISEAIVLGRGELQERARRLTVMGVHASLLATCILLSACTAGSSVSVGPDRCAKGGGNASISWVDVFKLEGITYSADLARGSLGKEDLGSKFGKTRCKLADVVTDPGYDIRDGDATFLAPGTAVYEVQGYEPWFRLAARLDGRWVLYEADGVPGAEFGDDLLDIEAKVSYISINSPQDGTTELAAIRGEDRVRPLVEMLLEAPVDQDRNPPEEEYDDQVFLEIHLNDRTSSSLNLYPESKLTSRGVMVPDAFIVAIRDAVTSASS